MPKKLLKPKKKLIVALIEVDESTLSTEGYPKNQEMVTLPDALNAAVEALAPNDSLDLKQVYLVNPDEIPELEKFLDNTATPFHAYAVNTRGETCNKEGCTEHGQPEGHDKVINLHARRPRVQSTH